MFKRKVLTAALLMAATASASATPYGFTDARSVGMGNASVATGGVTTAAFSNPAMLMVNETDETFALHLGGGIALINNGAIEDDIDDIQSLQTRIDAEFISLQAFATTNAVAIAADATVLTTEAAKLEKLTNDQINIFNNDLDGDSLVVRGSPNAALVFAADNYAIAISFEANAIGSGGVIDAGGLPVVTINDIIADAATGTFTSNPDVAITVGGALTQEFGLSVATDFSIMDMDVSIGVRPKFISAKAIGFAESLSTFDVANVVDNSTFDLGNTVVVDAGAVVKFSESLRAGIVAKNLIPGSLSQGNASIDFDMQLRVGAAYQNSFMTVAADMDLIEVDPINIEDASKMLALGVELNAWNFAQLRAGYQTNIASGASTDDLLSAGVGFWLGFNLDIAVVKSGESLGGFIQTGLRF